VGWEGGGIELQINDLKIESSFLKQTGFNST
jgi:hypothetical protein